MQREKYATHCSTARAAERAGRLPAQTIGACDHDDRPHLLFWFQFDRYAGDSDLDRAHCRADIRVFRNRRVCPYAQPGEISAAVVRLRCAHAVRQPAGQSVLSDAKRCDRHQRHFYHNGGYRDLSVVDRKYAQSVA